MNATRYLLVLLILLPGSALAAKTPWVSLNYGYGTLAMSDVNEFIQFGNSAAGADLIDEINGGQIVGVSAGVRLRSGISVGGGYEYLADKTEYSDAEGFLLIDLPAEVLKGLVEMPFVKSPRYSSYLLFELGAIHSRGSYELVTE